MTLPSEIVHDGPIVTVNSIDKKLDQIIDMLNDGRTTTRWAVRCNGGNGEPPGGIFGVFDTYAEAAEHHERCSGHGYQFSVVMVP